MYQLSHLSDRCKTLQIRIPTIPLPKPLISQAYKVCRVQPVHPTNQPIKYTQTPPHLSTCIMNNNAQMHKNSLETDHNHNPNLKNQTTLNFLAKSTKFIF